MWGGFGINAVTGVLLFAINATTKARQPVFYIKLLLIALALLVTAAIRRTAERGSAFDDAAPAAPRARRLAALSLLLWAGVVTAGRLMAYL